MTIGRSFSVLRERLAAPALQVTILRERAVAPALQGRTSLSSRRPPHADLAAGTWAKAYAHRHAPDRSRGIQTKFRMTWIWAVCPRNT